MIARRTHGRERSSEWKRREHTPAIFAVGGRNPDLPLRGDRGDPSRGADGGRCEALAHAAGPDNEVHLGEKGVTNYNVHGEIDVGTGDGVRVSLVGYSGAKITVLGHSTNVAVVVNESCSMRGIELDATNSGQDTFSGLSVRSGADVSNCYIHRCRTLGTSPAGYGINIVAGMSSVTLDNNTDVKLNQLQTDLARYSLLKTYAPFDPVLTSSFNPSRDTSPTIGIARRSVSSMSGCCARAASGHATAAPPTSVMNSRRFNRSNCICCP